MKNQKVYRHKKPRKSWIRCAILCAWNTMHIVPSSLIPDGSNALSFFMTKNIPGRWVNPKLKHFRLGLELTGKLQNQRKKVIRRHHMDPSSLDRAIKRAVKLAGVTKRITSHTFRHSFATHLLQTGTGIRTSQSLPGHNDVSTTMIYTHVLRQGGQGIKSPLDTLE